MVRGLRRLDLRGSRAGVCVGLERRIVRRIVVDRRHLTVDAAFGLVPTAPAARARVFARLALPRARRARKSVVSGKSVSVRVDLGGRRIIKKQNTSTNNPIHELD